jgi:hypothetical protein
MSDQVTETKPTQTPEQNGTLARETLMQDVLQNRQPIEASKPLLGPQGLLSKNLEQDLTELRQSLEKTQQQIAELQKTSNSGLFDLEMSRRTLVENPYKILSAGSGLAMLGKSAGLAVIPLTGTAALQGYDDFKSLREQTTWAGRGKYTLGLASDTAIGAGALAFLTESVPMKYKAPLLVGGMLARAAIDFIPNRK